MKQVDLSPEMVEAIQEMQQSAQTYVDLIDEVNEFIIELDIDINSSNVGQAYQCMRNLRSISKVCKSFIPKN